jgi:saccharopine dehydrogenase-like NADP-dependent oxidoreductase
MVRYLLEQARQRVVLADQILDKAEAALAGHANGRAARLDASNEAELAALVENADVVVSLLPYTLHPMVAQLCLRHGKDLVTTSYVSPAMAALDRDAKAQGLLFLNEVGLDPGLDHMSAMRVIADIRNEGKTLVGFRSCCGGLPAPDANDNPWGYKFSWSPRGVLLAGRNSAKWLEQGRVVEIPGEALFDRVAAYPVEGLGTLEAYPNRDALPYIDTYGIQGVKTMFRGTLRYSGWCETLAAVGKLGLLDVEPKGWPAGTTCAAMLASLLPAGEGSVRARVARFLGVPPSHAILERFEWAGLLSDQQLHSPSAPIDVLCDLLQVRMTYALGQRDMIVLQHDFEIATTDGRSERRVSRLIAYGEPGGDSAMARTVSLPAAIAVRLRLEGRLTLAGVHVPVSAEIYAPVLAELEGLGIRFHEGGA